MKLGLHARDALELLEQHGMLLESDNELPSLTKLITGAPIKGSWWGHERGKDIYNAAGQLVEHADVLLTKLVRGKLTFVHRDHWNALWAIATERADWQVEGLSKNAFYLLTRLVSEGAVETKGPPARELELRLLAYVRSVHMPSGAHNKVAESWDHCAEREKFSPSPMPTAAARAGFEEIVRGWGADPAKLLPWS